MVKAKLDGDGSLSDATEQGATAARHRSRRRGHVASAVFPKMAEAFNPLFRSTVRGAYKLSKKTKEMMADAHEQVNDIVAEVHAEADQDRTSSKSAAAGGLPT
jgi:selenocysteine lyase/cysteine desulfurase